MTVLFFVFTLFNSLLLISNHCLMSPDNGFHFQNILGGDYLLYRFSEGRATKCICQFLFKRLQTFIGQTLPNVYKRLLSNLKIETKRLQTFIFNI